jgi:hypothetical protein
MKTNNAWKRLVRDGENIPLTPNTFDTRSPLKNNSGARQLYSILLLTILIGASTQAQTTAALATRKKPIGVRFFHLPGQSRPAKRAAFFLMPTSKYADTTYNSLHNSLPMTATAAALPPAVLGGGTIGNISIWVGTHPSGNSILGDSIITQLNGNIGSGYTSKLTVQGMIERRSEATNSDGWCKSSPRSAALSIFRCNVDRHGTSGSSLALPYRFDGCRTSDAPCGCNSNKHRSGVGVMLVAATAAAAARGWRGTYGNSSDSRGAACLLGGNGRRRRWRLPRAGTAIPGWVWCEGVTAGHNTKAAGGIGVIGLVASATLAGWGECSGRLQHQRHRRYERWRARLAGLPWHWQHRRYRNKSVGAGFNGATGGPAEYFRKRPSSAIYRKAVARSR